MGIVFQGGARGQHSDRRGAECDTADAGHRVAACCDRLLGRGHHRDSRGPPPYLASDLWRCVRTASAHSAPASTAGAAIRTPATTGSRMPGTTAATGSSATTEPLVCPPAKSPMTSCRPARPRVRRRSSLSQPSAPNHEGHDRRVLLGRRPGHRWPRSKGTGRHRPDTILRPIAAQPRASPSRARKTAPFVLEPKPVMNGGYMAYQDEFVNHLVAKFGRADRGGVRFYAMDNEPTCGRPPASVVHPARLWLR